MQTMCKQTSTHTDHTDTLTHTQNHNNNNNNNNNNNHNNNNNNNNNNTHRQCQTKPPKTKCTRSQTREFGLERKKNEVKSFSFQTFFVRAFISRPFFHSSVCFPWFSLPFFDFLEILKNHTTSHPHIGSTRPPVSLSVCLIVSTLFLK